MMETLLFKDLERMEYRAALSLQENLVEMKQRERLPDIVLLVEHPHVFTIGRGGKESSLLCPGDVPVYRTSRGGDATYHGPGQMVIYPLLDLSSTLRRDVHRYLRRIERALIRTLADYGLQAGRKPPWTGVWIGKRKIAAIGIAVRRGITCHGLALNVNTDLAFFKRIVPCGLTWAEVTSIEKELGKKPPMEQVKKKFLAHFVEAFHYAELKEICHEDIQIGLRSEPREAPITFVSNGF